MTDLEFYQTVMQYQQYLLTAAAEVAAYNWNGNFCKEQIKGAFSNWSHNKDIRKLFDLSNLTRERALSIGFRMWNDDLLLFPLWYTFVLPYGTKVISISGEEFEFNKDTDLDHRFGYVAFGIIFPK